MNKIYRQIDNNWYKTISISKKTEQGWIQMPSENEAIGEMVNKTLYGGPHYVGYSVTYDIDGGSGTIQNFLKSTTDLTCSVNIHSDSGISKAHYDFLGWTDQNGNSVTPGSTIVLTPNTRTLSLKANWRAQYYIKYEVNAPSGTSPTISKTEEYVSAEPNAYVTLPNPSLTGYTFIGWYTDPNTEGTRVGGGNTTYYPTQNIIMKAHWVKMVEIRYQKTGCVAAPTFNDENLAWSEKQGPIDKVSYQIKFPERYQAYFKAVDFSSSWRQNFGTASTGSPWSTPASGYWTNSTSQEKMYVPEGTKFSCQLTNHALNYNDANYYCKIYTGHCNYKDNDSGGARLVKTGNPVQHEISINKYTYFRLNWRSEPSGSGVRGVWWDLYIYQN